MRVRGMSRERGLRVKAERVKALPRAGGICGSEGLGQDREKGYGIVVVVTEHSPSST